MVPAWLPRLLLQRRSYRQGRRVSPGSRGAPPDQRGTARGCSVDSSAAFGKHQAGTHLSSTTCSPLCSRRGGERRGWRAPARSREEGRRGGRPRSPSATQEDPGGDRSLGVPPKNPDKRTTQVPSRPLLRCYIPALPVQTAARSHPAQPSPSKGLPAPVTTAAPRPTSRRGSLLLRDKSLLPVDKLSTRARGTSLSSRATLCTQSS